MAFSGAFVRPFRPAFDAGGAAALPSLGWWDGSGTIAAGDVMEHVELPTVGQLYAGAAVASGQPWSIAVKSTGVAPSGGSSFYLLDSQTGRVILGIASAGEYGFYAGSWANVAIFGDTNIHVWFLVSSGSSVQAYLDNVATGSAQSSAKGIQVSGATRWRQSYANSGASWPNAVPRAAVYKAALNATQRAALYVSMAA